MTWEIWALFAVTETALCFTPGPAVLLVLSQGLARGTASSTWSNFGILAGNTMYFVLSGTSLGAALLTSYELFSLIRWVGAAYLVWLAAPDRGLKRARRERRDSPPAPPAAST